MLHALLLLVSVPAALAHPDCDPFTQGLVHKMGEYREYRQRNDETLRAQLGTETECTGQGAELAGSLAKAAAATSCTAELDASHMDKRLAELGGGCEKRFHLIHDGQRRLHARFTEVKKDLDDAMGFLAESHVLDGACPRELEAMRREVREFLELEAGIVALENRALDGKTNYGRFRETGEKLGAVTHGLGTGCANTVSAAASLLRAPASGKSAPVPAKRHSAGSSDITGTNKARADEAAGRKKLTPPTR